MISFRMYENGVRIDREKTGSTNDRGRCRTHAENNPVPGDFSLCCYEISGFQNEDFQNEERNTSLLDERLSEEEGDALQRTSLFQVLVSI